MVNIKQNRKLFSSIKIALSLCAMFATYLMAPTILHNFFGFSVKNIILKIGDKDMTRHSIGHKVMNKLYDSYNTNLYTIKTNIIAQSLEQFKLKNLIILKKFPDTIIVQASKRTPIAILQDGQKFYYVDNNGDIYGNANQTNDNLIVITGQSSNDNIKELIRNIQTNKFIMENIVAASFVGGRRWNLYLFKHGIKIMMPEFFTNQSNTQIACDQNKHLLNKIEKTLSYIQHDNLHKIKYLDCRDYRVVIGT